MTEISKSEFARRKGVTPAAITQYIKRGMPTLESGRLDPHTCDGWLRQYNSPARSGSFRARREAARSEAPAQSTRTKATAGTGRAPAKTGSMDTPAVFREAYALGRAQLRASLRQAAPALLAQMDPATVEARIDTLAVLDFLIESWLESSDGAIDIDWSVFRHGITPERARAGFGAVQDHCRTVMADEAAA